MSERAAGRELNIEIAERVFGEVEANAPCGDGLTRTATFIGKTLADCELQILLAYPQAIANGMKLWPAQYIGPDYSGDFAAAGLVVDEMNQTGYRVRVTFSAIVTVEWERMHEDASWEMIAEVEHGDFPMAVCLAALEGRSALSSSFGQGAE